MSIPLFIRSRDHLPNEVSRLGLRFSPPSSLFFRYASFPIWGGRPPRRGGGSTEPPVPDTRGGDLGASIKYTNYKSILHLIYLVMTNFVITRRQPAPRGPFRLRGTGREGLLPAGRYRPPPGGRRP